MELLAIGGSWMIGRLVEEAAGALAVVEGKQAEEVGRGEDVAVGVGVDNAQEEVV